MSGHLSSPRPRVRETVEELRCHHGLFSFRESTATSESSLQSGISPQFLLRPGGIVEWLVASEGAGAVTLALQILSQSSVGRGTWAVVDTDRESYAPALSGWGIDPNKILVLQPANLRETCWSIEQCLRCPGLSATWAWVDHRIPARVHRRWQMAAEVGGGVGMFFRSVEARREPIWADSRLLVTPRSGGEGESRRLQIEVLYRKGGLGGSTQAWEIDYAAGLVRLVPEVANPTTTNRAARA
jgi:cell division inhibitor SulA